MRSPGRERVLTALLAMASFGVGAVALEVGARLLVGSRSGKEAGEKRSYHEYDPLLGWRKKPGARVVYARREYTAEVVVNAIGLRDPDRAPVPPPGTVRVLALGDSYVEGYTVALADTVTQSLERSLRERGIAAEVINGGTAGYSTDQQLLFYRTVGRALQPKIVVAFFYYNDVAYNDRHLYYGVPKPVFETGTGELVLRRHPVERVERRAEDAPAPAPDDGRPRSAAWRLLRERLWYGAPGAFQALADIGFWKPMPKSGVRFEMRVFQTRQNAKIEQCWEKTDAVLAALAREVATDGARFVVAYVPSVMEVDDGSWTVTRALYQLGDGEWDRGRVARRLEASGRRGGFPTLDLTPALRRAGDEGRATYFPRDGHWNEEGHRVAAAAVQAWLAGAGWVPAR